MKNIRDWNIWGWFEDLWNNLTGQTQETARTDATNAANVQAASEANQTNQDIARETNATNKEIAEQNLDFQRDNLEYQKELQQQIFEREDTAYQRTKNDMLAAGLNPLTMQGTNGAGEAIATQPLNNSFQAQQASPAIAAQHIKAQTLNAPIQAIGYLNNIASGLNSILTGNLQRDSLRLQNQRQAYENWVYAEKNGIISKEYPEHYTVNNPNNRMQGKADYQSYPAEERDAQYFRNYEEQRNNNYEEDIGRYDSDTEYEKIITSLAEWFLGDRGQNLRDKLAKENPILDWLFNKTKKQAN